MAKLELKFNSSCNEVSVRLVGGGSLIVESWKREHDYELLMEIVNFITTKEPRLLDFTGEPCTKLIDELYQKGVNYDEKSLKLMY